MSLKDRFGELRDKFAKYSLEKRLQRIEELENAKKGVSESLWFDIMDLAERWFGKRNEESEEARREKEYEREKARAQVVIDEAMRSWLPVLERLAIEDPYQLVLGKPVNEQIEDTRRYLRRRAEEMQQQQSEEG